MRAGQSLVCRVVVAQVLLLAKKSTNLLVLLYCYLLLLLCKLSQRFPKRQLRAEISPAALHRGGPL